jgi:hypothetical protein
MAYHLREVLRNAPDGMLASAMPGLRQGVEIALNASAVAVDQGWITDMIGHMDELDGYAPDVTAAPVSAGNAVWVEFLSDATESPLEGALPGSHVLYGSAIQKKIVTDIPVYDLFAFFAVVRGSLQGDIFEVEDVRVIQASPIQCRVSQTSVDQPMIWQYRCIGDAATDETVIDFYRRDMVIHRMACKYLTESDASRVC